MNGKFTTLNPATEEVVRAYKTEDFNSARKKVNKGRDAFVKWSKLKVSERVKYVRKISELLLKKKEACARIMALEMGKPIKEGLAEIEKCAVLCNYYADNAEDFLKDELALTEAKKSYVSFKPLGIIFCIMPWNFPFWQVFRFAIPAILVGNVVLLRHSKSTAGSGVMIEEVFGKVLPRNVFQNLVSDVEVTEKVIELVDGVSFTGSSEAGAKVASNAANNLKKFVMELGGSDPFVVLADADIEKACEGAIAGRFINSGQSCIAAKRFIVHKKVINEFTEGVKARIGKLKVGNPLSMETNVGPLANASQLDRLNEQVNKSVAMGAKILIGGKKMEGKGFFFEPTLVTGVRKGMPLFDEEVFGPVLSVISARNDEEAIELANDTEYGLGASIWTRDITKGEKYSGMIDAGFTSVNQIVKSDPRLPFGGVKNSGFGRELSRYGMLEFCNIKTTVVVE